MRMRPGGYGWIGLVAYVALVDALLIKRGHSTLSEVFGDALIHPVKRMPLLVVWVVLTIHLFAVFMPPGLRKRWGRWDPIGYLARLVERS